MLKILVLLCCLSLTIFSDDLLSKFQQHDYNIQFTWAEVVDYNKSVFKYFKIATFKFNRTTPAANISWEMKIDIEEIKTLIMFQAYKFLSNEYRIFPVHFQVNHCNALEHNIAGSREVFLHCGNMTECDLEKDRAYHICNAYPDESKFPPLMPNGEYKLEITMTHENSFLILVNAYGKVSRKIKMPK